MRDKTTKINEWIKSNQAFLIILSIFAALFVLFWTMNVHEQYIESKTVTERITGEIICLNTFYDGGNAGGEITGTGRHYYADVLGKNNVEYKVTVSKEEYKEFQEGDSVTFLRVYYIDKKGTEFERICTTVKNQ